MAETPLMGRLTKDHFGASMPLDAPYYQSPPFYYRDALAMTISYETDADAAAALVPEGVEVPRPAMAGLIVAHYPKSTFGRYNEAILTVQCRHEGIDYMYIPHIVVDTVPPLAGGREIWGFPKKLASIGLEGDAELVRGAVERPVGVRLVTVVMRPERPLDLNDDPGQAVLSLRVIPSAEEDRPPSLAELIHTPSQDRVTHEAWSGPATLSYDAASRLDTWHAADEVRSRARVAVARRPGTDAEAVEKGAGVYRELFRRGDLFLTLSEQMKARLERLGCDGRILIQRLG